MDKDEIEIDDELNQGWRDVYGSYWLMHTDGLPECIQCDLGVSTDNPDGYCIFDPEATPDDICPAGFLTETQKKKNEQKKEGSRNEYHNQTLKERNRRRIIKTAREEILPILPATVAKVAATTKLNRSTIHSWVLAGYLVSETTTRGKKQKITIITSLGEKAVDKVVK